MQELRLYIEDLSKAVKPPGSGKPRPSARAPSPIAPAQGSKPAVSVSGTPSTPAPGAPSTAVPGAKRPSARAPQKIEDPVKAQAGPKGVKYTVYRGKGTPDPSLGYEQDPKSGKWRKPVGSGRKAKPKEEITSKPGSKEDVVVGTSPKEQELDHVASQSAEKQLVSSGGGEKPVTSSAVKIEASKHPVKATVKPKTTKQTKKEPTDEFADWTQQDHIDSARDALAEGDLAEAAARIVSASSGTSTSEAGKQIAQVTQEFNNRMQGKLTPIQYHQRQQKIKDIRKQAVAEGKKATTKKSTKKATTKKPTKKATTKKATTKKPTKKATTKKPTKKATTKKPTKKATMEDKDFEGWTAAKHRKAAKIATEKGEIAQADRHTKLAANAEESKVKALLSKKVDKLKVDSPAKEQERDIHKQKATDMLASIEEYLSSDLEMDPESKKAFEKIKTWLPKHSDIKNLPSQEEKVELRTATNLLSKYEKTVKEQERADAQLVREEEKTKKLGEAAQKELDKQGAEPSKVKTNYSAMFDRGRVAGEAAGAAAATAEGAGGLASSAIAYGSSGAVRGGQHLLRAGDERAAAPVTDTTLKKPQKKGAEVEQSSMTTEKALSLYIDLSKAVQSPNAGNTTPTDRQAKIQTQASYAKQPVGVASSGLVTEDDPDKGKKWKHSEEDSVQAEVDSKLKAKDEDEDEDENEDKEVTKSLFSEPDPVGFLKTMNKQLQNELSLQLPNSMEAAFMSEVLEHEPSSIKKGMCSIEGKDRHRFNEWMADRLNKSIDILHEKINK